MGGISKGFSYWFRVLRRFFFDQRIVRGEMSLGYGDYEFIIETPQGSPDEVFVSVEEPDDANLVCMGSINWVGARKLPEGFILYARIQSNTAIVRWIVEFDFDDLDENEV